MRVLTSPAVAAALAASALFGAGTPAAKLLLGPVSPWLLAGMLYAAGKYVFLVGTTADASEP